MVNLQVCNSVMLSQIGEEKCNSTMVDLVLYSETDNQIINDKSSINNSNNNNNRSTVLLSGMKRKYFNGEKCSDDSSGKLLRILQEKFTSLKRFRKVLILRGMFFFSFSSFPFFPFFFHLFRYIILSQVLFFFSEKNAMSTFQR